jgi:hypothetical protein
MKTMAPSLTKETIDKILHVDPLTGEITRKRTNGVGKAGMRAGTIVENGYRHLRVDGHRALAHRLMWFYVHGYWPRAEVDHINGDRDDNRISNLRLCCRSENNMNSGIPRHNTSGFKGAYFSTRRDHWVAEILVHRTKKYLGSFGSAAEAGAAYQAAAKEFYGDFAPPTK